MPRAFPVIREIAPLSLLIQTSSCCCASGIGSRSGGRTLRYALFEYTLDSSTMEPTMRFRLLSLVSLIAITAMPGVANAAEHYRIDPDHTFVHFAVVHTGVSSVRGRVGVTKGTATLDAAQQRAEVTVEIDPRTLDTGVKKLDALLSGEMFFDVA